MINSTWRFQTGVIKSCGFNWIPLHPSFSSLRRLQKSPPFTVLIHFVLQYPTIWFCLFILSMSAIASSFHFTSRRLTSHLFSIRVLYQWKTGAIWLSKDCEITWFAHNDIKSLQRDAFSRSICNMRWHQRSLWLR